ncbi:MAG: type II toxin-antitoxin system RelE/ParE family toxin [candidate division Zixibacteria bacterium]|nr:type II toxin-antitoxin system RelE/ParE family toxin [candidate division Zixibacteria bacterium]
MVLHLFKSLSRRLASVSHKRWEPTSSRRWPRLTSKSLIDYIALDSPSGAENVLVDFILAFELLSRHPNIGHLRSDLTSKPFRFWPVHTYLVIYLSDTESLRIIRILSGFREAGRLLTES